MLFGVAAVALGLGHRSDAAVISIVVLLNAFIGAFQEGRAERSLEGLRSLTAHQARVIRDSREQLVVAEQLVPGDVLLVDAGDVVVADARLLDAAALQVAEAALTGESLPVTKASSPLPSDTPLADRSNMLYAGTHLVAGRGRAVVIATGGATEIGHLAALAAAPKEPKTPLERRVAEFGRYIIFAALAMFLVVVLAGLARGLAFSEIALVGVSQVVGMIPEGLPVAMTVALAVGVQRMARRRAIIRRLSAVETLGSTTIICTDKTGTLTRNEMTVTSVALADGRTLFVTGAGYAPEGTFLEAGHELDPAADTGLQSLLDAVVLCNDAQLLEPDESAPQWRPLGDPTEVALLTLARKGGVAPAGLRTRYPRSAELPFDADDRMMATQHDTPTGVTTVIKGAPEAVLDLCRYARRHGSDDVLHQSARETLLAAADSMATQALRVLAVAIVEGAEVDGRARFAAFRGRASLLGFVGQLDPPRPEVKVAVENCRAAGIRPVMVTGDHKATGLAVARMLGIARPGDEAVDGRELEQMSGIELEQRVDSISVFARVHPAQKLQIVKAYQRRGEVVAMTGDG
ncbi:MAG: HAD-IC family P-type ATPase, partial [Dehalococcoidia bacterium]|nr:HAD-IC family P-type ATPase [Dehalococcoidia bacterium]